MKGNLKVNTLIVVLLLQVYKDCYMAFVSISISNCRNPSKLSSSIRHSSSYVRSQMPSFIFSILTRLPAWVVQIILNNGTISIYFVEEVYELFEVDFVVGFDPSYFDHRIDFFVCYALAQYFKYLL